MKEHLSYSQISTWIDCGHRYKLQYVDEVEQQPAWWTIGGKAFHALTEDIDTGAIGADVDSDVVGRYIDAAYAETVPSVSQLFINSKQDRAYWEAAIPEHLKRWEEWKRNSPYTIAENANGKKAVEIKVSAVVDNVEFIGFIDRIVGGPEGPVILDIKTGSKQPDNPLQLAFYRYALKRMFNKTIDVGAYFMTKNGKLITHDLSGYSDSIIEQYITSINNAKKNSVFIPNKSNGCFICPVKNNCAIYSLGGRIK